MPETVFYKKGKPVMIVKLDKSYCLVAITENEKRVLLSNENIYKELFSAMTKRK